MGESSFNSCLADMSRELSGDDLEYLKFLCEWEMPEAAGSIEKIKTGSDLFMLLENLGKLSHDNHHFLERIMTSIGREVLILTFRRRLGLAVNQQSNQHANDVVAQLTTNENVSYLFAECLVKVARSLLSREVRELHFLLRPTLQVAEDRVLSPTQLFLKLRRQLLLKEDDTKILQEKLCEIKRCDLVATINDFLKMTEQQPYSIPAEQTQAAQSLQYSATPQQSQSIATGAGVATLQEHIKEDIRELEKEFFDLTNTVEDVLTNSNISLEVVMRRFRMMPYSLRRQHQSDDNYSAIRRRALDSATFKQFFNNLTELKYWSYMTPEILTYIIQDVKDVHFDVAVYESKLLAFKERTKLKDMIGLEFLLPDHYIEVRIKVRGWQEKTILDAEKSIHNLFVRHTYQPSSIGVHTWHSVNPGSMELVLVLLEHIDINAVAKKELFDECNANSVTSIIINQTTIYREDVITSVKVATSTSAASSAVVLSGRHDVEWYGAGSLTYSVQGGRDVLIIESDLPISSPEVVPRRSGELTDEDRQKLKNQGVSSDDLDEASIVKGRYECDKRRTLFRVVKSEADNPLSLDTVRRSITELFECTKNDGVILYYIGAGRRNAGDWCFKDGFITFRELAQLYLRSMTGRVLTIVSDCSYAGCWVRDCMEFLDEQGVQPCGHKAREKGMLIKVYASCRPKQIPKQYIFSVHGAANDKNLGHMFSYTSKRLLDDQYTYSVNSSVIHCCEDGKTIEDVCELQADFTWQEWRVKERIKLFIDESRSRPTWQYVLLDDDEDRICEFKNKRERGELTDEHIAQYGQILESGWGREPPNEVKQKVYNTRHYQKLQNK